MTVVQAYICAKHYQVTWWSLWLAHWGVDNNGRPVAHRKETYSVTTFVSAGSSRSSQDPRPGGQREGARHSGHLRQLLILLRCAGLSLIKTFLKVFTELVRTALTNLTSTFLKLFKVSHLNMEPNCWKPCHLVGYIREQSFIVFNLDLWLEIKR